MRYDAYCMVDRTFFDAPGEAQDEEYAFAAAGRELPAGWRKVRQDDWLVCTPEGTRRPAQGWKVHASGCRDNAEKILDAIHEFCVPRGIPFKFLRGQHLLQLRNMKYAARGASGKLVTVYPADERELREVLEGVEALVGGEPGPYILSDLRFHQGPLYVRYGGFVERHVVSEKGVLEPAIERPDGTLVPDRRLPGFHVPEWVTLPEFLRPHAEARRAESLAGLPYTVRRPLHFSNGGGVYVAEDTRTGREVILKEARPHAGLTADGRDAVSRLQWERDVLERLAGVDAVPAVLDYFTVGDHHFLAQELVEGRPLSKFFGLKYPETGPRADPAEIAAYTEWAMSVCRAVEDAVASVHARGIVFGDLHPYNILVTDDGRVGLIDFEVAAPADSGAVRMLGHPAYAAPRDRAGFAADTYALACIKLAVFLPLTALLRLDLHKSAELADEIAARFPVPREFLDSAVREIVGAGRRADAHDRLRGRAGRPPRPRADHRDWPAVRGSLAGAILASATPTRDDRLFPGDIAQFSTGALNLAHGAAGVLYALDVTGAGRHPEHEQWLLERATRREQRARLGFYDGLHGTAFALGHLGHHDAARQILDRCMGEQWQRLGTDLYSGLSGVGLNLLHFAQTTGDSALRVAALDVAATVARRLGSETDVPELSGGRYPRAGLLHGSSGPALLFIRCHEATGDPAFLDLATTALRQDLRRCVTRDDGALHVNEGWRSLPYLAEGSAGVALVLDLLRGHRDDDHLQAAAAGALISSSSQFYVQSGLFNGRAGIISHLAAVSPERPPYRDPLVAAQIEALSWHALEYQGQLAFPGEQLLRLSMDLATGSAGVLLALGSALHTEPVHLPFLGR
ncbi:class III lanthionine synthetase LanKC [Streptomyces dubilierae]|uniref:non-specific serine/threonine protein kinase n=1 Tax=Streptomyces dubilierae TaxID=3075533 RepID=A0ABU2PHG0_9ACTN|nr:class III lanthionine synthetase LanKC [Streptomyces sp. DSM 41921]MDT0391267.1 class III lanthionine synthetase LanKC [Streptomyces sp. DSM 41921]